MMCCTISEMFLSHTNIGAVLEAAGVDKELGEGGGDNVGRDLYYV